VYRGDRVLEDRHLTVEHPDVDEHALAGQRAVVQRGIDPRGEEQPGGDVADGHPDARRLAAVLAGDAHHAAHPLHDHVVGGPGRVRACASESRHRRVDQARVTHVQRVPAEPQLVHRPGPEVLDEHVGHVEQPLEDLAVGRGVEIEGDASPSRSSAR